MKYAFSPLAFGLTASAAVLKRDQCCFQLTASGGTSGTVGQLSDGQNRIGGSYSAATYCLNNGGITDSNGRGCILTSPTTQFQCDTGATATTGFSVGSGGDLTYNGSTEFYACPADEDEYNIYTSPVENQSKCVEITLSTGGQCASSSGSSSASSVASTQATSSQAASSPPTSSHATSSTIVSSTAASSPAASSPAASSPAASSPVKSDTGTVVTSTILSTETVPCSTSSTLNTQPQQESTAPATSSTASTHAATSPTASSPTTSSPTASSHASSSPAASSPATSSHAASSSATSSHVASSAASSPIASSAATSPAASTPVASSAASTPAVSGTASSSSSCPTDLSGQYQYPHLIVPVNSTTPDQAYGTSYFGEISSTVCSTFNFDIPSSYSGATCSVLFLFPERDQLETSNYTVSGSGSVTFSQLSSPVSEDTTYNTVPSKSEDLKTVSLEAGNGYLITSGECTAGETIAFEACGSGSFSLNYFQDYNPSPIGLYVRKC